MTVSVHPCTLVCVLAPIVGIRTPPYNPCITRFQFEIRRLSFYTPDSYQACKRSEYLSGDYYVFRSDACLFWFAIGEIHELPHAALS